MRSRQSKYIEKRMMDRNLGHSGRNNQRDYKGAANEAERKLRKYTILGVK